MSSDNQPPATSRNIGLPPAVAAFAARLAELLPSPAYVVGGSLRDLLLGRPLRDLDLAVAADAAAAAASLAGKLGGSLVALDRERGIYRVVLKGEVVEYVDVAQLRGDVESDLRERDFTVDAMAARLAPPFEVLPLIDPLLGVRDLEARCLRPVSDRVFQQDPLRLLRAVRLCVELGLVLAPDAEALVRRDAALATRPAPERQRDELVRMFATGRAAVGVRMLDALGLLEPLLPEVTAGRGVTQPKEHYYDVLEHAVATVAALDAFLGPGRAGEGGHEALRTDLWSALPLPDRVRENLAAEPAEGRPRRALLKFAGLLHDVAKPQTKAPDPSGRIRFLGHCELGEQKAAAVMRRLRFSERETAYVALLVREHLRPLQLAAPGEVPTRRALFRFFRDLGDGVEGVVLLSLADHVAARGPLLGKVEWRQHLLYASYLLHERYTDRTIVRPPRLLTGRDVMAELGIGPGPEVGRVLAALEEAQAAGEVCDREQALRFVRSFLADGQRRAAEKGS